MKKVTRNIDFASAQDLLAGDRRACLAFAGADGAQVEPAVLQWRDGRYLVGIPARADGLPAAGAEVVLLVDEGVYFFQLRALYVRGTAQPSAPPAGDMPAGCRWIELLPTKTVAWDYGQMREVDDDDA